MGENSKIEWTDHTFNPWIGCAKVHDGCRHCYAEDQMDRRYGKAKWGPGGTRVVTSAENWAKPRKWNADCRRLGTRARVFCASLADVFENWKGPILDHDGSRIAIWPDGSRVNGAVPEHQTLPFISGGARSRWLEMQDVRQRLFALIDETPHLDWLLLTKRPENIRRMWVDRRINVDCGPGMQFADRVGFRSNVWLGCSISDQPTADAMIPELLKCRDVCAGLFVSAEPLLGSIDLPFTALAKYGEIERTGEVFRMLNWLIAGGESGPNARPMHPDWARGLRDQCQAAGVPFFFKQWGSIVPASQVADEDFWDRFEHYRTSMMEDDHPMRVDKRLAGATLDGREWRETPFKEATACET